jgi:hypothetical protein
LQRFLPLWIVCALALGSASARADGALLSQELTGQTHLVETLARTGEAQRWGDRFQELIAFSRTRRAEGALGEGRQRWGRIALFAEHTSLFLDRFVTMRDWEGGAVLRLTENLALIGRYRVLDLEPGALLQRPFHGRSDGAYFGFDLGF